MRLRPNDVSVDARDETWLCELTKHDSPKVRDFQRGRPKGDQRLPTRLGETVLLGPRDPLGKHGQGPARLLVVRKGLPLPLEDRKGGRVKWVARLEPCLEEVLSLRFGGRGVHGRPLGWQLSAALETPVRERLPHATPNFLVTIIVEQAAPNDFRDFGFVVRDQILRDAPYNLRDLVLPL